MSVSVGKIFGSLSVDKVVSGVFVLCVAVFCGFFLYKDRADMNTAAAIEAVSVPAEARDVAPVSPAMLAVFGEHVDRAKGFSLSDEDEFFVCAAGGDAGTVNAYLLKAHAVTSHRAHLFRLDEGAEMEQYCLEVLE